MISGLIQRSFQLARLRYLNRTRSCNVILNIYYYYEPCILIINLDFYVNFSLSTGLISDQETQFHNHSICLAKFSKYMLIPNQNVLKIRFSFARKAFLRATWFRHYYWIHLSEMP